MVHLIHVLTLTCWRNDALPWFHGSRLTTTVRVSLARGRRMANYLFRPPPLLVLQPAGHMILVASIGANTTSLAHFHHDGFTLTYDIAENRFIQLRQSQTREWVDAIASDTGTRCTLDDRI